MADHTKPPSLRVVTEPMTRPRAPKLQRQLELSMGREPHVLGLFWLSPARMRELANAIGSTRPRYVFDLRVLPSLEGSGMTRRSMLRLMEASGCTYVDAIGRISDAERWRSLFESGEFEECVRSVCGGELVGPMFFLFQSVEELARSASILPLALQPAPPQGWSLHVLGDGRVASLEEFAETVQAWKVGETVYIVASPTESTGWLLDERGRPGEPIHLPRGSSVRVTKLQVGQWTDVEVLAGTHRGRNVRLASSAHVARLVK